MTTDYTLNLTTDEAIALISILANNSHLSNEINSVWRKYSKEYCSVENAKMKAAN